MLSHPNLVSKGLTDYTIKYLADTFSGTDTA